MIKVFLFCIVHNFLYSLDECFVFGSQSETIAKSEYNPYRDVENKINEIKKQCGKLCEYNSTKYEPILDGSEFYYVPIEKEVNCKALWNSSIFDKSSTLKLTVQKLPVYLRKYFSYNNIVDIKPYYFDEKTSNIWNQTFNTWGTQ